MDGRIRPQSGSKMAASIHQPWPLEGPIGNFESGFVRSTGLPYAPVQSGGCIAPSMGAKLECLTYIREAIAVLAPQHDRSSRVIEDFCPEWVVSQSCAALAISPSAFPQPRAHVRVQILVSHLLQTFVLSKHCSI